MAKKNYYCIESIVKAFEVIEALANQPKYELAELSRCLGMPKTTVHRILLTLADLGYVVQEESGTGYTLTFKFYKIGSQSASHTELIDIARPYCRTLQEHIGETVNLSIPSDTQMIVVDKLVTTHLLRQDSVVGTSFPVFRSASGKAYLAFVDQSIASKLLDRIRVESKGRISEKDIEEVSAELPQVRESLVAFDNEEIYAGVRCAAVPIFDFNGEVAAVLSVSAPTVRFSESKSEAVAQELRDAAEKISLRFGASAYPPVPVTG